MNTGIFWREVMNPGTVLVFFIFLLPLATMIIVEYTTQAGCHT